MTPRLPVVSPGPGFDRARAVVRDALGRRICPAAVVEVGDAAGPLWREAFGSLTYDPGAAPAATDTVFDLASLTKVIATTTLVMRLSEKGRLRLDDRVADWFPAWRGASREDVRLQDLLAHASGLPDTRPLYEQASGRAAMERAICEMPLDYPSRSGSRYSDLGFILLGFVIEDAGRRPLAEQFSELAESANPAWDLRYGIAGERRGRTAPTQVDLWRGRLLQGEVDDRNAAALGGVAGHSGLFGTAAGVGDFARAIIAGLEGRAAASGVAAKATLSQFVRRVGTPGSSRALGWDTMLPTSSCGTRMSPTAFGHTGFTGTSLWIDAASPVYVVLLTNRVHPVAGPPEPIRELRRSLHDAVMDAVLSSG